MTEPARTDPNLRGRHIIVGVSGGIAAYKAPQLVRLLREQGAEVQVVMTAGAAHFVTATTLQAVSGRTVRDDLWDPGAEAAMGHIELARWADLILVAPATADLLSRLAQGRADDLLCTLRLASRAPVVLAPAMNQVMWQHPATQRNLRTLLDDGCRVVGPDSGPQACGEFGPGRMSEPADICQAALDQLAGSPPGLPAAGGPLLGRHIVITAGPTREAIDPVRYISNHSSGKQGYALAEAALAAGAQVTLISGPVALTPPPGAHTVAVQSALDMLQAVQAHLSDCDIFIGVAAVADYRPTTAAERKLKKSPSGAGLTLSLAENPDIIAAVAARPNRPFVVGFAAETHDTLEHARDKRRRKGLDVILVNDVADASIGFNSDDNELTLISEAGEERLPRTTKTALAEAVIARIGVEYARRLAPANPQAATT